MQSLHSPTFHVSPFESFLLGGSPKLYAETKKWHMKKKKKKKTHMVMVNPWMPISASVVVPRTSSAPRREKDPKKRVVITGMGVVSVFGNDVDTYYDCLLQGKNGITTIDRFDVSEFPTQFAGQIHDFSPEDYVNKKQERQLENHHQYGIVAGMKALKNADLGNHNLSKINKERASVIIGTAFGGSAVINKLIPTLIEKGHRRLTPYLVINSITNMTPALLAIDLGFMGPTYSLSTACSTANHCFYAAANHIRDGDADLVLAGGTDAPIVPVCLGGFISNGVLSQRNGDPQTASRPWDKERDGIVLGEGAGVLVMESLEHAMKRGAPIIAEYLGGAVNFDAHHMTDPRIDGHGISLCIRKCLQNAGVSPEEVNFINAHATSTILGDQAEVNAINQVFKDTSEIKINATKSIIGHSFGAAGALEAIATLKAITMGWLHPTINQFDIEPSMQLDTVANKKKQHEVNVAISNSFGFGGHNSVIAFSAFKP